MADIIDSSPNLPPQIDASSDNEPITTENRIVRFIPEIIEACREIKELGIEEASETLRPELIQTLAPPTSIQEALELARSYQPGQYSLEYLELNFPEIDPDNLGEITGVLIDRAEKVFGSGVAQTFELILRGGDQCTSLSTNIWSILSSKARRTHTHEGRIESVNLEDHQQDILDRINLRICHAARFMLYAVSYDPYPDRDYEWYGCPVGPDEFLTSIIFTALDTPFLKQLSASESLRKKSHVVNYISTLSYHSPLGGKDFSTVIREQVINAQRIRHELERLRADTALGPLNNDNLYGTSPGKEYKLKEEEKLAILSKIGHRESLTALAVDSLTTIICDGLVQVFYERDTTQASKQATNVIRTDEFLVSCSYETELSYDLDDIESSLAQGQEVDITLKNFDAIGRLIIPASQIGELEEKFGSSLTITNIHVRVHRLSGNELFATYEYDYHYKQPVILAIPRSHLTSLESRFGHILIEESLNQGAYTAASRDEAQVAFFLISILSQGWIDGVLIDYLLDESFRILCPDKYERAVRIARSAMAFNIQGHQVKTGPWTNEDAILTWASVIYLRKTAELFLTYADEETQESIQILDWESARRKGFFSQYCKALDLGTGMPPRRYPLTYKDWRNRSAGYRDPNIHSFDMMGSILVLSFPQTSEEISRVVSFFKQVFEICPFIEELYTHLKYADPISPELYFSIHAGVVITFSKVPIGRHLPGDINIVEIHLPGGRQWQEAYSAQHARYALAKLAMSDRSLAELYNDIQTLVFIYAGATGVSPQRAVELLLSFTHPPTIKYEGRTYQVVPEEPFIAVDTEFTRPVTMKGGLLYDLLITSIPEITAKEIIALIRSAPSITLEGQSPRRALVPSHTYQHQLVLLSMARLGERPRSIQIYTKPRDLVARMRSDSPNCLGQGNTEINLVDSLIKDLSRYFEIVGFTWYDKIGSQKPPDLLSPLIQYFSPGTPETRKKYEGTIKPTRVYPSQERDILAGSIHFQLIKLRLKDRRNAKRLVGMAAPITYRCARYDAIRKKPGIIQMKEEDLVNLIIIGSSAGAQVSEIIERHIIDHITRGYIRPKFLYACVMQAERLYSGTGDLPSAWINRILSSRGGMTDIVYHNYLSLFS